MNQQLDQSPAPTDPDHLEEADVIVAELVSTPTIFLDGSRRLRTVWRFLIFGVSFVFLQIAIGLVVGLILVFGLIASGDLRQFGDPQRLEQDLGRAIEEWTPVLTAIVAAPLTALTLGLVFVCRKYLDRRSVPSMGFVRQRLGASILVGCIAGLLPIATSAVILVATGALRVDGVSFSVMAALMIPALVLMAFMEEIVFRGYLLQNVLDIRRPVFGVVFTSLLFWIVHGLNPHVWSSVLIPLNMFGAGVVLALAYLVGKNIWFPTALHFGWNAAQGPLLGLPVSGMNMEGFVQLRVVEAVPAWLTGGEFGLEASVAVTVVEVALLSVFLCVLRSRAINANT